MRRALTGFALVVLALAPLLARPKPDGKHARLRPFLNAGTVAVVIYPDGSQFSPTKPEDMNAVADVEQALRAWKRFIVVSSPASADFVIGVRRGRHADAVVAGLTRVGKTIHPTIGVGIEAGPAQDMLVLYRGGPNAFDAPAMWRYLGDGGLQAPALRAVAELKRDLDEAARLKSEEERKP